MVFYRIMKRIARTMIYGYKATESSYIKYLKKIGVQIGCDVQIYAPNKTTIDEQYPWLITIGDHVRITEDTIILTHDYSWSVIKRYPDNEVSGAVMGCAKAVCIGDNVFIGMRSTILGGSNIGNNVIIGAGSVVSGKIPDNSVAVGVPAKVVGNIKEYYNKRKKLQIEEACNLANAYKRRTGKIPPKEIFREFFMVFTNDEKDIDEKFKNVIKLCSNFNDSINYIKREKSLFDSYEDFLKYCFEGKSDDCKK